MKSKYRIYEEKEDHYREKANDMEAMGIFYGVIGLVSMVPIMLVLTAFGISEESAKPWAYVGFVPCLICAFRWVYFSFMEWLTGRQKNI